MSEAPSRSAVTVFASRRAFLQAGGAAGGALLLGFHMPLATSASVQAREPFAPNAFIRIDQQGKVIHPASGRTGAYAALVEEAGRLTPPREPQLKAPADFKLIGKPLKRLDTPEKVNGKALYGIDVMPPGVKFATLRACPVFGGKVGHVDDSKAKQIPGVRQIVALEDLVAVVGDHMWAATRGLGALEITWEEGENAQVTSRSEERR